MYQQSQNNKTEIIFPTYWEGIDTQKETLKLYDVDSQSDEYISVVNRYFSRLD
jgi:hypothetical protein